MEDTQELIETLKSIKDNLEVDNSEKIIGIDYKDKIDLGGELTRKSVFVVKLQDSEGKIHYLVSDKDFNRIATIANDGKIELSPREKQLWEQFIGKENEQTAEQKKYYDFDKEYFLDEYKEQEKEVEDEELETDKAEDEEEKEIKEDEGEPEEKEQMQKNEKQQNNQNEQDEEKQEIAKSIDINSRQIKTIIKIEDRENFGKAIDKKLYADAFIVKYGNNKIKLMHANSRGEYSEISGLEYSEFSGEVLEQLHINKTNSKATIKQGDLTTIRGESRKDNFVIVREKDPNKGIAIRNTENATEVYTFDERNINSVGELKTTEIYKVSYDDKIKAEQEADLTEEAAKEAVLEAEKAKDIADNAAQAAENAEQDERENAIEEAEYKQAEAEDAENEAEKAIEEAEKARREAEDDNQRTPWGDAYDRMNRH